jgi:hypothetical protein
MDGVLADFDRGYDEMIGVREEDGDVRWDLVEKHGTLYGDLPPTPDFELLWEHVIQYDPIILTGIPWSMAALVRSQKRKWIDRRIGTEQPMIGCPSKDKSHYCKPGDIIIDDTPKYRHLWEAKGGICILHTSAADSIRQLRELTRD